jgi:nuclear RNA export factor
MLDDPIVQKYNLLVPGVPGSSGKETAIMFRLAAQLRPAVSIRHPLTFLQPLLFNLSQVQTLSLANNNIQSGKDISSIGMFLPKLINLSLANNQLKAMDDIRALTREKNKLEFLRELVLTGNPIKGSDPTNTEQYRRFVPFKLRNPFTSSQRSTVTLLSGFPLWRCSITNEL